MQIRFQQQVKLRAFAHEVILFERQVHLVKIFKRDIDWESKYLGDS